MQYVITVHQVSKAKAYDIRMYNWRAVIVLLAIAFSVANTFQLAAQEASVTPPRKKLPGQYPIQIPPVGQRGAANQRHVPAPPIGPHRVRVPDIVGLELRRGLGALTEAGLVGTSAGEERSNRRPDEITHQRPQAGTLVDAGSSVQVWVAKSAPPPPGDDSDKGGRERHIHDLLAVVVTLGALASIPVLAFIAAKLFRWQFPKIKVMPFKDHGEQHIEPPGALVFALELYPVLDLGDQELEKVGPLVSEGGGKWTSNV